MPCTPIKSPGFTGIVCKRGQNFRKRCAYCGDYTGLCGRCTTKIAGDGDLCREHAPMWGKALGGGRAATT